MVIGDDRRLVQGAGGNLSAKVDRTMWIKSSGTRLVEAETREIFLPLDLEKTREAVLKTEDLSPLVDPAYAALGLRPSIETALHALLPHRWVYHVHGVGAIGAGLSADPSALLGQLGLDAQLKVVRYARPGIDLAVAVFEVLDGEVDAERPLVLLLENHGIVVGADTADATWDTLVAVEEGLRRREALPDPDLTEGPLGVRLAGSGSVDPMQTTILLSGPLTPDSAVFLGRKPFAAASDAERESPCVIADDGSVWVASSCGPDEIEIAWSLVDAVRQVGVAKESTAISSEEVDRLLDWEAEKWRQKLKR